MRLINVGHELLLAAIALELACGPAAPPARSVPVAEPAYPTAMTAPANAVSGCDVGSQDESLEPVVATTRRALEEALGSPALPGVEALLADTVVISTLFSNEAMERDAAARWLRDRATASVRLKLFQPHHHAPMLEAVTEGWSAPTEQCLTVVFHRYAPSGAQGDDADLWQIDVITPDW